jgi:DNA-binding response OmpR family regulator
MPRSILLVSRDDDLQISRSLLLQDAGYTAYRVDSVQGALMVAKVERPNIALLCHTLSVDEQETFIERAQETNSSLFVVCVREREIPESDLIGACERCFRKQPGMSQVIVLSGAC